MFILTPGLEFHLSSGRAHQAAASCSESRSYWSPLMAAWGTLPGEPALVASSHLHTVQTRQQGPGAHTKPRAVWTNNPVFIILMTCIQLPVQSGLLHWADIYTFTASTTSTSHITQDRSGLWLQQQCVKITLSKTVASITFILWKTGHL